MKKGADPQDGPQSELSALPVVLEPQATVEEHGLSTLGVLGYDERGCAVAEPPRSPKQVAWLYNAMRAAFRIPRGKLMTKSEFETLINKTANITIG